MPTHPTDTAVDMGQIILEMALRSGDGVPGRMCWLLTTTPVHERAVQGVHGQHRLEPPDWLGLPQDSEHQLQGPAGQWGAGRHSPGLC